MKRPLRVALATLVCLSAWAWAAPQSSKIWPLSDEGAAYLIENLPNVEIIGYPVAPESIDVPSSLYAVVEVPAYVELFSNTYRYSREMPAPNVEDVQRDGRVYKRYTFAPPRKDEKRWARFFAQWVPRPTDEDRRAPGRFVWHFETPEGPEPEQSVPIKLLPELPETKPPKRMLVNFWSSSNCNTDPDRLEPVMTLLSRAGVNLLAWWEAKAENMKAAGCCDKGIRLMVNQGGMSGWKTMGKETDDPRYANRDNEGNAVERQDLQWVIDEEGKPWESDLRVCATCARKIRAGTGTRHCFRVKSKLGFPGVVISPMQSSRYSCTLSMMVASIGSHLFRDGDRAKLIGTQPMPVGCSHYPPGHGR